jgi:histidine ammonia-lyase
MGATAARKLRSIANNLESILALELLCAAQGIDFRKKAAGRDLRLGIGTRDIYATLREKIPFIEHDTYMKAHIDSAQEVVRRWQPAN